MVIHYNIVAGQVLVLFDGGHLCRGNGNLISVSESCVCLHNHGMDYFPLSTVMCLAINTLPGHSNRMLIKIIKGYKPCRYNPIN